MYRSAKIIAFSIMFILMMLPSVALADIGVTSVSVDPERIGGDETALVTINLAATLCPADATAIDAMMVVDRSGSMVEPASKINAAVDSAISFVDRANSGIDRIGIASFNDTGTLDIGLSSDFGAVRSTLNELRPRPIGFTAMATGTGLAVDEIFANRSTRLPIMIILSDGVDYPTSSNPLAQARRACDAGVQVYTIGLGATANIDVPTLTAMTCNGGFFERAEAPANLNAIYDRIAAAIRQTAGKNVSIRDLVPSGVSVVEGSISNGGVLSGSEITWNIADISSDTSLTYQVESDLGEFESGREVTLGTGSLSYEGCGGVIQNVSVPNRDLTINHCPECQCELINNTALLPAQGLNPSQSR